MATTNITVSTEWTLIASNANSMLITALNGYGEICQSTGMPASSLNGHLIGRNTPAYSCTGEIYERAVGYSGNQLFLAIT